MTHGDDDGLILPPAIAPIQVVIVPVAAHKPGVLDKCRELIGSKSFPDTLQIAVVLIAHANVLRTDSR